MNKVEKLDIIWCIIKNGEIEPDRMYFLIEKIMKESEK